MNKKFGFIGTGNMGGALARAAAKAIDPSMITLTDQCAEKAQSLASELGCQTASFEEVVKTCDIIFLGVKPQVLPAVLVEMKALFKLRPTPDALVSMAAGVTTERICSCLEKMYPVIRIMPNIPASVGSGMILYDMTQIVSAETEAIFRHSMAHAGLVDRLPEKLIDAGSALSGCGPAFVSLFVEALADGAVACGLPRDKAITYALQTVAGSAQMLMCSGQHPGQLKDAVCSPGGSTIAGVAALEQGAFRATVMEAISSAYQKTRELGK